MLDRTKQKICLAAGFISFGLGIIGIFLPIMPTTPFIILAAFFFNKGSTKWHKWITTHPRWGALVVDWETHGVIRRKHKVISTILILGSMASLMYWLPQNWMRATGVAMLVCVIAFIWTRPSAPKIFRK